MLDVTPWAHEILRRADDAARRLNPDARVRLSRAPAAAVELRTSAPAGAIHTELVDEPSDDDQVLELGDVKVYVAADVDGLIDVEEPHDRIVLKPHGSAPSARGS